VVLRQQIERLWIDAFDATDAVLVTGAEKVRDQNREVFATLPERRNLDDEDGEPEEQVLSHVLVAHRRKAAIAGRDNPYVDAAAVQATHWTDVAILEDAEEFGLDLERQLAHFVKEQAAVVRRHEQAGVVGERAGEGAATVTEQLALDQIAR
jgi:hypothetical protein